tara:strand:- start:278 stop:427 length:150 start_codon:yes stop_codon:yes gene_type:complete
MKNVNLYNAVYNAFLKAAIKTGDDYKNLSWFGRNKISKGTAPLAEKEAA